MYDAFGKRNFWNARSIGVFGPTPAVFEVRKIGSLNQYSIRIFEVFQFECAALIPADSKKAYPRESSPFGRVRFDVYLLLPSAELRMATAVAVEASLVSLSKKAS